ncbi:prominin-2 [Echeneis naucrates]|uniref:Prominin-1-A-like n=1 Tax=Echeneis naucrates TaxID=173247 RepID=A0A665V2R9_ECHNA|nr:prominin-1-A-like [Echeneis naucrates]XP_029377526.1 prominin-1-A-like [Echeneis naucrates]
MGLCEIMRGWSCSVRTGGLGTLVGLMLLEMSLAQLAPPHTACGAAAAPQNLTQPHYQDSGRDNSSGFMAALVQSFLHTVQPKPFPGELILKIVNDLGGIHSNQEAIKEVLVYEVGFLVCAAIGVLYIILMPIVGFFLACCRCCGNCGGKMYQKQTSSIHCRRRTLYWSAFITTIIILAGNICMFKSNEDLKVSVNQSPMQLNTTLGNIHIYLTSVPQQFDYVVSESYKTIQEVTGNLDDIGHQLGTEIQQRFNAPLASALQPVRLLNQENRNISFQLGKLNLSLAKLQSSLDQLLANVSAVRTRINETLSSPDCQGCNVQLQELTLDTTITTPGLNQLLYAVDRITKMNLTSKIAEAEDYFNSIPQTVIDDTRDVVQQSKQHLGDIKRQISHVASNFPALTGVSKALNQVHVEISKVTPEVKRAEYIRWAVCVALCCGVLLVVVCNLLGLVLGPFGLKPKEDPAKRSCMADCGGTFLMMGAGFSFLFSWLFMIVVLLLFLLGGNVYTLLCRPWSNGQLFKFIDTPGLVPPLDEISGFRNISFSDIYKDCEENQPLWTTFHLHEIINLEKIFNISQYAEEIQQQFDGADIRLSNITLLSSEDKHQLSSFSAEMQTFNSTAVSQQMDSITNINLNATIDKLDQLAVAQTSRDVSEALRRDASNLRQIQSSKETTIDLQVENLRYSIKSLQSNIERVSGTVGEVLSNVGAAQDFLATNMTQIVKIERRTFLDCQLSYFITYADWATLTITKLLGRCQPVVEALDSAEAILCSHAVESLNAFWFSLGWCLIFFIPSIIFSVKLAKYYRKLKLSDVNHDHIIMNHIPRAQMRI